MKNKKEFLVYFMNKDFVPDILIITADSPEQASDIVTKLPKVLQVLSVWGKLL